MEDLSLIEDPHGPPAVSLAHRERLDALFAVDAASSSSSYGAHHHHGHSRRHNSGDAPAGAAGASGGRRKSVTALAGTLLLGHAAGTEDTAAASEAAAVQHSCADLRTMSKAVQRNFGFLMERDIDSLALETGYSRLELYSRFIRFKALCALGSSAKGIDRATFRHHIPALAIEDEAFVNRVFDLLDSDGSQLLDWDKYLLCMSALERGSRALRAEFMFKCADYDGTGLLTPTKLFEFIALSLRLNLGGKDAPVPEPAPAPAPAPEPAPAPAAAVPAGAAPTAVATVAPAAGAATVLTGATLGTGTGAVLGAAVVPPAVVVTRAESEAILRDFSARFFAAIDTEGNGSISLQQTLDYVEQHREIEDVSSIFGRAMVLGSRSDCGMLLREAAAAKAAAASGGLAATAGTGTGRLARSQSGQRVRVFEE